MSSCDGVRVDWLGSALAIMGLVGIAFMMLPLVLVALAMVLTPPTRHP
jgi:hypothetical protein